MSQACSSPKVNGVKWHPAGIVVNAVGWGCYPSTWHGQPVNADLHHERLWDWSDSELTRCWREGPKAPQW